MRDGGFSRLAPFVREYIWRNEWQTLRDIQATAIAAVLDSDAHILICSATASGKTEAALFPIISDLHDEPPASIGALYIGPTKALINDQFERLDLLLEESGIPAQSWHGDVPQAKKTRFLRRARGILQITPESLEAMLMRRHHELGRLFGELRYVVIDEAHAFIDSDRGRQVICQLERLSRYQKAPARRIGLSATIGEPQLAMAWLRGNSPAETRLISSQRGRGLELGLEHYLLAKEREKKEDASEERDFSDAPETKDQPETAPLAKRQDFLAQLYDMTWRGRKTLIFANTRQATEGIVADLRRMAEDAGRVDIYHAHHGSVSAPLREAAEAAMRDETARACVAATVTLELGIDIGQLDQVLQVNATHTVSSFVQRLGRSGRRGNASRMFLFSVERQEDPRHIGESLPWNLLRAIAIMQLYLEERWIEPPHIPRLPLSLLYHQTMSVVYAHSDIRPALLAERILTLSPFRQVEAHHFRELLRHLLEIEHLEHAEDGRLIIGLKGEAIVNDYHFYAVFKDNVEFTVREKSREIGTIPGPPEIDATFALAGFTWRVLHVDMRRRIIEVKRVRGRSEMQWQSEGPDTHARLVRKMRQVLLASDEYPYLHDRARQRLEIARRAAVAAGIGESGVLPLAPDRVLILPWCGSRQFQTQRLMLEAVELKAQDACEPYFYELKTDANSIADMRQTLLDCAERDISAADLADLVADAGLQREKYDIYAPTDLLREAYARDRIDIPGAVESLRRL